MKRVLLVALGTGIVGSFVGFFIPIFFARDTGFALMAILTGPYGFILGFTVGFAIEADRQDTLSARRLVSLLYIPWFMMSLYYLNFVNGFNKEILFGATIIQTTVLIAICGILMGEKSIRELLLAIRSRQRICAIAALVMTAMLFFPPAKPTGLTGSGHDFETGYVFILDEKLDASTHYASHEVETQRIIQQWLLVFVVSYLYYFLLVGRRQTADLPSADGRQITRRRTRGDTMLGHALKLVRALALTPHYLIEIAMERLSEIGRANPVDPRKATKVRKASLRRLRIQVAVIFVGCAVVVGLVWYFE